MPPNLVLYQFSSDDCVDKNVACYDYGPVTLLLSVGLLSIAYRTIVYASVWKIHYLLVYAGIR
jgi:hypothetical protein